MVMMRMLLERLKMSLVVSRVGGGDGGGLEDALCQPHARLAHLPEVEAGGGAGENLLNGPRVLHRELVVQGRR